MRIGVAAGVMMVIVCFGAAFVFADNKVIVEPDDADVAIFAGAEKLRAGP